MEQTKIASKDVKCTAAIATAFTIAKPGADDDTYSVAAADTDALIGIFQATTTAAGQYVEVMTHGISRIVLGGTVTRGQKLTSDVNGNGVAASAGNQAIGIALESGVSGDIISVLLAQGTA
jgi:hypothetical protein